MDLVNDYIRSLEAVKVATTTDGKISFFPGDNHGPKSQAAGMPSVHTLVQRVHWPFPCQRNRMYQVTGWGRDGKRLGVSLLRVLADMGSWVSWVARAAEARAAAVGNS